ncbi:Ger(x)C family spore germination protein [Peribacillus acanthi]|uniref:Ger(x)C family spore germination protein n=1 Tax=Peribacillus acanthi TaxID=2171554 RepID=UPI000D3EA72B|nr:Ger(x)C family spore germination protein [Peribacillus acanthi]
MTKQRKVLILLSTTGLFLSGCMNIQPKILDDVNLATAVGYDYVDDKTFKATAVTPRYLPDKKIVNETFTSVSTLSKEIRGNINQQTEKPMVSGKIEVVLYSEKIAKKDITKIIDNLQRDPSIGSNVNLAVVEGKAEKALVQQFGNMDKGIFISNLIVQNIENGFLPKTNLHLFLYAYYSEGMDPFLPLIKPVGNRVSIEGMAFFDKGKYVYHTKPEQNFAFTMLASRNSRSEAFKVKVGKEEYASLYNISAKRTFDIHKPMSTEEIIINLKVDAILREFSSGTEGKPVIKEIEKAMIKEIEKQSNKLIKKFQSLGIDPIGIGNQVRTRTRDWDKKEWDKIYPTIKIKTKVKVNVLETGVIE